MDFPLRGFLFLFMEFTSWSKTHIQRNTIPDDTYVIYVHVNAHIIVDLSSLHCNTGRKMGVAMFSV